MRLFLVLFVAFLTGCVAVPERAPLVDPASAWRLRQESLARVNVWEVRGRLALRSADEGFQASLHWVRHDERHRIEVAGPLGGGRVRMTQDRSGAELRDADNRITRDSSVQELLWRRTGWDLPLDGLNYWVLGLPAPGAPMQSEIDDWGRLKTLEQLGWDIRFLEYTQQDGYELPSRVFIKRRGDDAMNRTLEVRLAIEKWNVSGAKAGE